MYEHFRKLATRTQNSEFDTSYLTQIETEVAAIYAICLQSEDEPALVTDEELHAAINSLNRGKAADGYGVTAEHVYYGNQELLDTIKILINNILLAKSVSGSLKLVFLILYLRIKENVENRKIIVELQ